MSQPAHLVSLGLDEEISDLVAGIRSAAARAEKSDPADRGDIVRYESLSVALELRAAAARQAGAPSFDVDLPDDFGGLLVAAADLTALPPQARETADRLLDDQHVLVAVVPAFVTRDPSLVPLEVLDSQTPAPPPAERWEAPEGLEGRKAVEARFRGQIIAALASDDEHRRAISPSGIPNAVVTEILREHVLATDRPRVDAAVEYRDGSRAAHAFPLRSLSMESELPPADLTLRMALLSIRHTEMDVVVDGAWLRNAEISRPRPAAQTDDLVFEISRRQLAELTDEGKQSLCLYLYQTGLETAVLGFYRAAALHMLKHPGTLSVVPMYHQAPPTPRKPKRGNDRKRKRAPERMQDTVIKKRAPFREGTLWVA